MIEVGRDSASNVNSVGPDLRPFPLTFGVRAAGGSWLVDATAAQAGELAGLLAGRAAGPVAVVDLHTCSFVDEDFRSLAPSLIAAELGVDCAVHPVGAWASDTIGVGGEFLLLDRGELPRLLDGTWTPYQVALVDLPGEVTPERLDELALAVGTTAFDQPLLPLLEGSTLWFSGHDDCYLRVESTDPEVPGALLGRLLALLAGSALTDADADDAPPVLVPEPDPALAERLIATSAHWAGTVAAVSATEVALALTALPRRWRLRDPAPAGAWHTVTLDLVRGRWRLDPAP
ncbi:hypothetical protein SAMN05216371_4679 [Streptomyces sp. TLI_053]|uniref:hypothetical protein n=1 Tax=Streptomyces sp. TLI_053 TaxID=1855352 RepID=UPI000879327F|nr:hypothetical protein [Streptomyces sp. TLI_053]SDT74254.1 hypothetical protein SAMN05216371_4679 [Streptomyces sp. TLI_053]